LVGKTSFYHSLDQAAIQTAHKNTYTEKAKIKGYPMNSYERILKLIAELNEEKDKLNDALSLDRAKHMLILSECVTASLQAFLFKHL